MRKIPSARGLNTMTQMNTVSPSASSQRNHLSFGESAWTHAMGELVQKEKFKVLHLQGMVTKL